MAARPAPGPSMQSAAQARRVVVGLGGVERTVDGWSRNAVAYWQKSARTRHRSRLGALCWSGDE
eukprot:3178498-Alexandrium_andersonii.AAC.1